jgi:ribosomal protein L35
MTKTVWSSAHTPTAGHIRNKKTTKLQEGSSQAEYVDKTNAGAVKKLLPYS